MHSILIADDHPFVLFGIKVFLEQRNYNVVCTCNNGIEAYNYIVTKQPTLALLDIDMPGMTGIEVMEKLSAQKNRTKVILLTINNEYTVFNYAKKLGVKGFILKGFRMDEMEKCLHEVEKGRTHFTPHLKASLLLSNKEICGSELECLTPAEKKILELISKQRTTKEIARLLFISEKTVETHRSHIIKKLNIPPGKNTLLMWAIKNIP